MLTIFQTLEDAAASRIRDNTNEFQMMLHTKRYLNPTPTLISSHISISNHQQLALPQLISPKRPIQSKLKARMKPKSLSFNHNQPLWTHYLQQNSVPTTFNRKKNHLSSHLKLFKKKSTPTSSKKVHHPKNNKTSSSKFHRRKRSNNQLLKLSHNLKSGRP